ncbi:MAG: bifunctional [glutamate--ammonia ligase]-adenylyl-L-tyrosine phosphorylase/[glutamate--ammonia-ligase] adenylyltransferase [Candidatus Sumerlaeaceae bacterium]|nr:bifunctional [glutamate--ammonia ligase]-adenylyl-L-tyrosine phosphorylase/[glutamate--ammonia-ligase] adenylyltransferase [Candidatus Sumerlaeaceae bacterium]
MATANNCVRAFVEDALAGRDAAPPQPLTDAAAVASCLRAIASVAGGAEAAALACEAVLTVPAPDKALNNIERFVIAAGEADLRPAEWLLSAEFRQVLATLMGSSQYLADLLVQNPGWFSWLMQPAILHSPRGTPHYRAEVRQATAGLSDSAAIRSALCRLRHRETLRIAARDLLGLSSTEQAAREISDLAQAIIAMVAHRAYEETRARFGTPMTEPGLGPTRPADMCVIAMGKLGARELNFSSDVDLVFVYEAEGETTGTLPDGRAVHPQANHLFFTRMGETIVRFLGERTAEGRLFRVDMRLRPEGETGPLARSLESFVNYLQQQARDWERVAYLKARVLSGPTHLAERIYRVVEQFVFSQAEPERIVAEVERLKLMIDREVMAGDLYHRELKRGYGGIREIEFVVSAMQIIYGRTHPALRARNTFLALQRLREVNLLPAEEAAFYLEAYEFLRRVEHRLQMADEHQTHTLPVEPGKLAVLARSAGFAETAEFLRRLDHVRDGVHRRFTVFFQHDPQAADRELREILLILDPQAPAEEVEPVLERFGLGGSDARRILQALARGTSEIFVSADGQRSFEQMLPSLLRLASQSPDPARVLPRFHSFVLAVKGITYYYELISRHPDILRLLVELFGTSGHFSQLLVARPEYFDALISSQVLYESVSHAAVEARISQTLRASRSLERQMLLLRRAANFETLLCALRYLVRLRDLPDTLRDLSLVADVLVECSLPLAARRAAERLAARDETVKPDDLAGPLLETMRKSMAVMALGKYGGAEISFFSDLDVVFVYKDEPPLPARLARRLGVAAAEVYCALADALSFVLSENLEGGRVFSLDARLRPHGRNSPIATPVEQYIEYLCEQADVWELLAVQRLRRITGPDTLREALMAAVAKRRPALDRAMIMREAQAMRRRLEQSVPASVAPVELKRSAGGLVDAEFAVQLIDLLTAGEPGPPDYFARLELLAGRREEVGDAFRSMQASYMLLREVETGIRVVTGTSAHTLPSDPATLKAIARRCGGGTPEDLQRQIVRAKTANRHAFERICTALEHEKDES